MTYRAPNLPFLPGFTFDPNLGRTKFNCDPKFDYIAPGVRALKEKVKPNMLGPLSDKYPSIYPRGEVTEIPSWLAFDKHVLTFDAFFQETLQEVRGSPFQVRNVKIYFFLEDGTIQVMEPKVENSGLAQGTLISRQRIRFPEPMSENFYDLIDFNVGREVEFYGRVFKITNCDKFSRHFLNRCGISVPDPILAPTDPYMKVRSHDRDGMQPKKPNRTVDTRGKFLDNDRKVLRFKAYWDDRKTEYGYIHNLEVLFYLADDTIEINEKHHSEPNFCFLRRTKLAKTFKELPSPGYDSNGILLNVLGSTHKNKRYLYDPLECGKEEIEYYSEKDFSIGGTINCFGRNIVLIDCDVFTKDYFSKNYGLEELIPINAPTMRQEVVTLKPTERELPPWNGFGTHEDSAQNCMTVEPKAPLKDFKKFLSLDRVGMDSHILKFEARMVSKIAENCSRVFIISYFLSDDTVQVFEVARDNSGFKSSAFFKRAPMKLPGQREFTSKPPLLYTAQHMFVGATLILNGYQFVLIDADEYAFRYMEVNSSQFPKANINMIMNKVRESLRPIYKDFVAENMPNESNVISYEALRSKLCKIMDKDFTEHEMITISRAFSAACTKERYDREKLRALCLTELKRFLWDDLTRLREYFLARDPNRCGILSKEECYTVLKGCRLPFDKLLIERILKVIKKNEKCELYYEDLLDFLDRNKCPMADVVPVSIKSELWWGTDREVKPGTLIDWCAFNKNLDLESTFKQPVTDKDIKYLEEKNLI